MINKIYPEFFSILSVQFIYDKKNLFKSEFFFDTVSTKDEKQNLNFKLQL